MQLRLNNQQNFNCEHRFGLPFKRNLFLFTIFSLFVNIFSAQIDPSTDYIHNSFINSYAIQGRQDHQHHVTASGSLTFFSRHTELSGKDFSISYGYGKFGELSFLYNNFFSFISPMERVCNYRYGNYIDLWPNDRFVRPIGIVDLDFNQYFTLVNSLSFLLFSTAASMFKCIGLIANNVAKRL